MDGSFVSMPEFDGAEHFPSPADDLPQLKRHGRLADCGLEQLPQTPDRIGCARPAGEIDSPRDREQQALAWSPHDKLCTYPMPPADRPVVAALTQPARPIVLLGKADTDTHTLAPGVAPGLDEVGVMLPYTPLHHLLLDPVDDCDVPPVLVMTSGNLADEPLCFRDDDARNRLGAIADAFVMHDREIAVPCDDSVVAVWDGRELPVRRSRMRRVASSPPRAR